MDGAVDSGIALNKAAIESDKSIIERKSNKKIESNSDVGAVAGFWHSICHSARCARGSSA